MQKAYVTALYEIMQTDRRVVSILSDSGTDYDTMMASDIPSQCFNVGIAEQCQIGVAAGMARIGKIPFVYTSGAFLVYRGYEFIRDDVCYQNQNVKLVGMGSGTSWCTLGPSHHTTEDVAVLRSLPNLMLLSPATPIQAAECVRAAYAHQGPVYLRLGMSNEPEFFPTDYQLHIGQPDCLCSGTDVVIFTTGSILEEVMGARALLSQAGINAGVYHLTTLKPMDTDSLCKVLAAYRSVVTVEEHNVLGGLGSILSEQIAQFGYPQRLLRIGLNDCFSKGYGSQREVRYQNALDGASIAQTIMKGQEQA